MTELRQGFIDFLRSRHPGLADLPSENFSDLVADHLLCAEVLRLPSSLNKRIREIIRDFDRLRSALRDDPRVKEKCLRRGLIDPGHKSIMMSFDFHLDAAMAPRLIEINTNAAFHLLNHEMRIYRGLPTPAEDFGPERFRLDVLEELRAFRQRGPGRFDPDGPSMPAVAITDENPPGQRMYLEFLLAREWFKSYGWSCEIRDFNEVLRGETADFVYNRSTDFYLESPAGRLLNESIVDGRSCVSPNPHEYLLLADKERMIEWTTPGYLEGLSLSQETIDSIRSALPGCWDLSKDSAEDLWSRRKTLFFKPKREFGSKKAFRGSSISRKLFDELTGPDTLAQEFVPAPEVQVSTPEGSTTFKYDLRCYSYGDRLESVVARVYQGQVTNLKTPHGGFAPVVFED